jgi:hypothetical protein
VFKLLQRMTEGHFAPMQNFLRSQVRRALSGTPARHHGSAICLDRVFGVSHVLRKCEFGVASLVAFVVLLFAGRLRQAVAGSRVCFGCGAGVGAQHAYRDRMRGFPRSRARVPQARDRGPHDTGAPDYTDRFATDICD